MVKLRIFLDNNGVSELLGYILILTIVSTAIGIILVISAPELIQSQDQTQQQSAEQAFTILDSHTSKAQYSNNLLQMTEMKLNGGNIYVDEDDSYIEIWFKNEPNHIYKGDLGTIHYIINGHDIGYQAGGLWESYPDGGSIMISAPDFNYKRETLTLPLMQLKGTSSVGGTGTAYITTKSGTNPVLIFPKGDGSNANPVTAEKVYVYIKSDYYKAWRDFINSRTDGIAEIYDDNNKIIKATFNTLPSTGTHNFRGPIEFTGLNTTNEAPLQTFKLNMYNITDDYLMEYTGPTYSAPEPYPALHIEFQRSHGEQKNVSGVKYDGTYITVTYEIDKNTIEKFENKEKLYLICDDTDTCDLNLLDSSIDMEYTADDDSVTWNDNDGNPDVVYHKGNVTKLDAVIQHYIKHMVNEYPEFKLSMDDKNNENHLPGDKSTYTLYYDAKDVLTYLHVTNNPIDVSIS